MISPISRTHSAACADWQADAVQRMAAGAQVLGEAEGRRE
jgi:hypothetical protein